MSTFKRVSLRAHRRTPDFASSRYDVCPDPSYCRLTTVFQDDDYLVLPEVIMTLNSRINLSEDPHTIHLLPAHEYLSSSLREIHVPSPEGSKGLSIHTSFAWLGHGAMLHRSEAVDFLALMRRLNTTDEQMKMADNYYTILSNRIPEVWFDQGIELGGGQPFTVGSEGEERNNRHIVSIQILTNHHACG